MRTNINRLQSITRGSIKRVELMRLGYLFSIEGAGIYLEVGLDKVGVG